MSKSRRSMTRRSCQRSAPSRFGLSCGRRLARHWGGVIPRERGSYRELAAAMEFQILGQVQVSDVDRVVGLGSPKERCVLASLLIRANQVVSLERLVDEVWGEEPPDNPPAAIHAYISRLRGALDPDRGRGKTGGM